MKQYLDLQRHILDHGVKKEDRTGTGTLSVFGYQMRYDLSQGFPLMTTKDMSESRWNGIVHELLWFLAGDTDIKYLLDNKVNIWTPDAHRNFSGGNPNLDYSMADFKEFAMDFGWDLGPIYGAQWRSWVTYHEVMDYDFDGEPTTEIQVDTIDQISQVIDSIQQDPDSRRHIVSAWNVADIEKMALPPCHVLFQFYVANGKLSCQLYQRSADVFLGVPFNIASYALLTHMIAEQTGLEVGEFVHTIGDAHIYLNHIEQTELQLTREPKPLPQLVIKRKPDSIFDYLSEDFEIVGYDPHEAIKGKVSV